MALSPSKPLCMLDPPVVIRLSRRRGGRSIELRTELLERIIGNENGELSVEALRQSPCEGRGSTASVIVASCEEGVEVAGRIASTGVSLVPMA
jgi:hypothetical protein